MDDIDDGFPSTLSIAQFPSGDWKSIPDEALLYRDPATGELGRIPVAVVAAVAPETVSR